MLRYFTGDSVAAVVTGDQRWVRQLVLVDAMVTGDAMITGEAMVTGTCEHRCRSGVVVVTGDLEVAGHMSILR